MKKMAFSQNVWPSAAPPLLPLFHGADANTPTPASCEATDLQGLSYVRVQLNLVPSGARPMRRTSTSPPSPSRISDLDYAPSSASPAACPGSFLGWLGPNGPVVNPLSAGQVVDPGVH